jgi:ornithine carbamoyltransferase
MSPLKAVQASATTANDTSPRHFLDLCDFEAPLLERLIANARRRKDARAGLPRGTPDKDAPLVGRMLALIFERPSTRTRISFDVGMQELGGRTLMLTGAEMQLGRGESIADTARVLSRYVDAIMIRTLQHGMLLELAANASVPVVNGLTKLSHPCQVMADVMTFEEKRGPIRGRTIAWSGDANNVLASWVHAAARFGFTLKAATPAEFAPGPQLRGWAKKSGGDIHFMRDVKEAVRGADCVVTDTWVSMGDKEAAKRQQLLKPYQVNKALMAHAAPDAIFMHCLPAHRGEEVTDDVIDGPQSAVFDEAENRMHVQKAILEWCLG